MYQKGWADGEPLAIADFLNADFAGLVVGYVLISHTPSHVHHLELQSNPLAVLLQAWESLA